MGQALIVHLLHIEYYVRRFHILGHSILTILKSEGYPHLTEDEVVFQMG